MNVGTYRHHVTLDHPGPLVPDGLGGFLETWAPLAPADWECSIDAATARDLERVVAGAGQTTATHLIRGHYHPGITTDTRLTFEGRVFEVTSVQDDEERHVTLTLVCTEMKA